MDRPPQIVIQRKSRTELERLLADGNTAQNDILKEFPYIGTPHQKES